MIATEPSTSTAPRRATLSRAIAVSGRGIHSGEPCRVSLEPAPSGHGIKFQRAGRVAVPANWRHANAEASDRRTVIIGEGGERFEQIEHLMAALWAYGVSDALVIQEGPEVPFLGGGSKEYCDALVEAGVEYHAEALPVLTITKPFFLADGNVQMVATPHKGLRLSCFVEFPGTIVGSAGVSQEITASQFHSEAAPARTFALSRDLEMLRQAGMIKGGDLTNAVVFDETRYYNEFLNFPDEVARHKIIDLLGDLALTGAALEGHFWAWRAGHRSHVRFATALAQEFLPCPI